MNITLFKLHEILLNFFKAWPWFRFFFVRCDADLTGDIKNRKSVSGLLITLNVSCHAHLQLDELLNNVLCHYLHVNRVYGFIVDGSGCFLFSEVSGSGGVLSVTNRLKIAIVFSLSSMQKSNSARF